MNLQPKKALSIVFDFNNIARFPRVELAPGSYRKVDKAWRSLKGWLPPGHVQRTIIADRDVMQKHGGWYSDEIREISKAQERSAFFFARLGEKADDLVLELAKGTDGLIVSHDRYIDRICHGHERLLYEQGLLIKPTNERGMPWTWAWVDPNEKMFGDYYGAWNGRRIDREHVREVELETGFDFRDSRWQEGEPMGVHHAARFLDAQVSLVRKALRKLGHSDYLGAVISEDQLCQLPPVVQELKINAARRKGRR